jgi:hypothetical protein
VREQAVAASDDARLVSEALRLNARYVEEVVIGWGLCPWAAQAWRDRAVARRVLLEPTPAADPVLGFIDAIAVEPTIAIGFAIFPRAAVDEAAFGTFAERVRRADRARRPAGAAPPFLLAAFHPRAGEQVCEARDPAALVSFIRRTPDPMLQLVRADLLARLGPDVSGEIARANFATTSARTPAALDALVRDIRRDRDASYASSASSDFPLAAPR